MKFHTSAFRFHLMSARIVSSIALVLSLIISSVPVQDAGAVSARPARLTRATRDVQIADSILKRASARAANRVSLHKSAPVSATGSVLSASAEAPKPVPTLREFRAEVLKLVNERRAVSGLAPYAYNKILEASAQKYAEDLEKANCFSHTECGSTLKERMHASSYYHKDGRSYYYGENIARGQDTAAEVVQDWMDSPSHRAAILSEKFNELGIGKSGTFWVQHFGLVK